MHRRAGSGLKRHRHPKNARRMLILSNRCLSGCKPSGQECAIGKPPTVIHHITTVADATGIGVDRRRAALSERRAARTGGLSTSQSAARWTRAGPLWAHIERILNGNIDDRRRRPNAHGQPAQTGGDEQIPAPRSFAAAAGARRPLTRRASKSETRT